MSNSKINSDDSRQIGIRQRMLNLYKHGAMESIMKQCIMKELERAGFTEDDSETISTAALLDAHADMKKSIIDDNE